MTLSTGGAPEDAQKVLLRPQPVTWAYRVTIAWAVFTVLTSLSLFVERPFLRKSLVDNNAKAKKPIANLSGTKLDDAVHSALVGGTIQAILMTIILVMLATMLLRGRGWARWALMAFATILPVFIGVGIGIAVLLFGVLTGDSPMLYRVPLVAAGLCSLAVFILLLMPETNRYFAALRPPGRRGSGGRTARPVPATPSRATRTAGPVSGVERRHNSVFGALFVPRRSPGSPDKAESANPASDGTGGTSGAGSGSTVIGSSSGRSTATRPGSVKAKGSGGRQGRSKSRQD